MTKTSRRTFLRKATQLGIALPLAAVPLDAETQAALPECIERVSLNGIWQFRLDPEKTGESQNWHLMGTLPQGWTDVTVPHTWQITPDWADYMGVAWYRRSFFAAGEWANGAVRVEFEAVFHSATVWVNGEPLGKHLGKGYTAFTLDITRTLHYGEANIIAVKVDNAFNEAMLPRGGSSDWANDGGIYRPVSLLVTPKAFIERVDVDALPDIAQKKATLEITVVVQNLGNSALQGTIGYRVVEEDTGQIVFQQNQASAVDVKPGASWTAALPAATLESPKLWHFDHPHLYRLETELDSDGRKNHASAVTFGVRSIEVSNRGFYLNGQRVFLMGVERMGGSHPDYGAAEPAQLLIHDHNDLKEPNTVFTRVHWQQDQRVLDYCDRHGILIQLAKKNNRAVDDCNVKTEKQTR